MLTRIKGTQDILDVSLYRFLLEKLREHLILYNFNEISTPILERAELFQQSVGLETDVVSKEMYFVSSNAEQDSEEKICLRPEITASVVRAFINNNIQKTPWRVFTTGPVFRHERPQKGRFREFNQISLEVIGSNSPASDVAFMVMLDRFLHEKLTLNSYALLINFLGCSEDRLRFKDALRLYMNQHEEALCETCKVRKEKNILRVLDCKNETCKEIYRKGPIITQFLCVDCEQEWKLIQHLLHELSVSYSLAPMLVRGLDYYNKIIFEFVDVGTLGSQNTFCGGGRYDTIATKVGSKQDYPSIGCGFGVERMVLMLEGIKDRLPLPIAPALHVIVPFGEEQASLALQVADELYAKKFCVDILFEGSIKSKMKKANDLQAATSLIIGPDEQAAHIVTVKDMKSGIESKVPQRDVAEFLQKYSLLLI